MKKVKTQEQVPLSQGTYRNAITDTVFFVAQYFRKKGLFVTVDAVRY